MWVKDCCGADGWEITRRETGIQMAYEVVAIVLARYDGALGQERHIYAGETWGGGS